MRPAQRRALAECALAVAALPLAGAWIAGRPLAEFFAFPPVDFTPQGARAFSWWAAAGVMAILAAVVLPWAGARGGAAADSRAPPRQATRARGTADRRQRAQHLCLGLVWTLAWWVIAWDPATALAPLRANSFSPLWLGYIVLVRALAGPRAPARSAGQWAALFAGSAVFWWGFEWLNRFAGNWHYHGVERYGPLGYAAHATLCFSTVLPAVTVTSEALAGLPPWAEFARRGPRWAWLDRRPAGWILLGAGAAGLLLVGRWPQFAYPALWLAPLLIAVGGSLRRGEAGPWRDLARGNWHPAASWMAAALICGVFWELWNFRSFPKWTYTVPFVNGAHVFEMPLLGYSGYLSFGLECWAAAATLAAV